MGRHKALKATARDRDDRTRTLRAGVITSLLSRGIAVAVPLVVIPAALRTLGVEGYGVWATAMSLTSLVVFADLGIGAGLMTRLGQMSGGDGRSRDIDLRPLVASAYAVGVGVAAFLVAALLIVDRFVNWADLLGHHGSVSESEVRAVILLTFGAFAVNVAASLIVRVQYGVGRQALANTWQAVGNLGSLSAVIAAALWSSPPWLFVALASFVPVVFALINSVWFFSRREYRTLAPLPGAVVANEIADLWSLGRRFLLITILLSVTTQLDPWLVARTASIADAADFAVPYRVYALVGTLSLVLTQPLWPLHSNAIAKGDILWVRKITARMTIATVVGVGISGLAAAELGRFVLPLWLHGRVGFHQSVWLGLAVWWLVQSATAPMFMVLNGAEVLGLQILAYGLFLASIPLKYAISLHYGYAAIPWVGAALYALLVWPFCWVGYKRALAKAATIAPKETTLVI